MKYAFILIAALAAGAFAQCPDKPQLNKANVIATKSITVDKASEATLSFVASSAGTNWMTKDAEAAAVTVFVDGVYSQDILLFKGESKTGDKTSSSYEAFLGELPKGEHRIEIAVNKERSAKKIGRVAVGKIAVATGEEKRGDGISSRLASIATANAPILYTRPNAVDHYTDIPLVMYYEILDAPDEAKKIQYTVIFTNEDGGTQSKALMARWGRMTDIEWMYELTVDKNGSVIEETYQAANHRTLPFKGKRIFGSHPLMFDVTDNNNFADTGCSALRFAPTPHFADLTNGSRETVMERFPWTWRIMSEEMFREGRVASGSKDPNIVEDPREYVYAEIYALTDSAGITFEAETKDGRKFASDNGSPLLHINRPGYVRIALHLPADVMPNDIKQYSIPCYATGEKEGSCKNVRLVKIVRLDKSFYPVEIKFNFQGQSVRSGETAIFHLIH